MSHEPLPRLNLLSDPLLLALLAAALCPSGEVTEAELLARQLEHLRLDETAVLGELSPLRATLGIEESRLYALESDERRSRADLRLFEEQSPAPARPPRRSDQAGQELEQKRSELREAQGFVEADLKAQQGKLLAVKQQTLKLEERQAALGIERLRLEQSLRASAAASVLGQLSRGAGSRALGFLDELRRLLRGDSTVGILLVLCELLAPSIEEAKPLKGAEQARAALLDLRALFAQSAEPLPRVLEALIKLREGQPPRASDPGIFQAADFRQPSHYRLYQLIGVLCGQSFSGSAQTRLSEESASTADPDAAGWSELLLLLELQPAAGQPPGPAAVAWLERFSLQTEAPPELKPPPLNMLLRCALLLELGQTSLLTAACGIELPTGALPPRRGLALLLPGVRGAMPAWPRLDGLISERALALKPPALQPIVSSALCCCVLLGAREHGSEELYMAWLAESYGWPKQDIYWWTLARLNGDSALLKNCTYSANELFAVPRALATREP